jgi:uncharacterized membrane protein
MSDQDREDTGDDGRSDPSPFMRSRFRREGFGLEFDRFANFADAIYAISLTLIVVGIEFPGIADKESSGELLEVLGDLLPDIITFFVVFLVVGNYWIAHHRFVSWLAEVDRPMLGLQLAYLALIAFLPFPAAVLGATDTNPVAFGLFALVMAGASFLETIMIGHAHRADLMRSRLTEDSYRWERAASLSAVLIFLISIPFAFLSPWIGFALWFLNGPVGFVLDRRRPPEFGGPRRQPRR